MSAPSYRLRDLALPARLLLLGFLVVLSAGFAMAHVNLHLQHADLDGEPGLAYADVVAAYHGRPGATLLASKIDGGSMERYIPRPEDKATVLEWLESGALEAQFEPVAEVLDRLCVRCHHPGGEMSQVSFAASRAEGASFDLVSVTAVPDRGKSVPSLARSSHAHLFGMGMLFLLAGAVFLGTDVSARTKSFVVVLPFVAVLTDIGCWWMTRLHAGFAVGIIVGGLLLGLSVALIVLRSGYELLTPRVGNPA